MSFWKYAKWKCCWRRHSTYLHPDMNVEGFSLSRSSEPLTWVSWLFCQHYSCLNFVAFQFGTPPCSFTHCWLAPKRITIQAYPCWWELNSFAWLFLLVVAWSSTPPHSFPTIGITPSMLPICLHWLYPPPPNLYFCLCLWPLSYCHSLHLERGGSTVLQNVDILAHH